MQKEQNGSCMVYKSNFDGRLIGVDRRSFEQCVEPFHEWSKFKQMVASMDVPVWMFESKSKAMQFDESICWTGEWEVLCD